MARESEYNRLVGIRNTMVVAIEECCGMYEKDGFLNRKRLANVLTSIANTPRFTVDTHCEEEFEVFNDIQTGKHIKITEEGTGFYIRVFKVTGRDYYRTDYPPYYLETEEEQEAEAQWERDAESAYEKYLDAKASMDDPRGF